MNKNNLLRTGNNRKFFNSAILNDLTFIDYKNRFQKLAMSIFEWVNLPSSMDSRFLELSLYLYGSACLLKDKNYGYINTHCNPSGKINIYGLPVKLNCYSFDFRSTKLLYTGLPNTFINESLEDLQDNQAILVMNDWNRFPTSSTLDLFAYRLYEAERSIDINVKLQKFPIIIKTTQKQKLSMENFINKMDGNQPFILADKNSFDENEVSVIKTDVPYVADKLMIYKRHIWNEVLTFLRY